MVKTLAGEAFGASGEAGAGEGRARRDDFKAGTTGLKIGWRRDQRNRGRAKPVYGTSDLIRADPSRDLLLSVL